MKNTINLEMEKKVIEFSRVQTKLTEKLTKTVKEIQQKTDISE